nr:MAG TPA: hypothetical protein [Caudoviricetes sp.]
MRCRCEPDTDGRRHGSFYVLLYLQKQNIV